MVVVGFTGTRYGMTSAQQQEFRKLVARLWPTLFVHGDCVGSDAEAHNSMRANLPGCKIEAYPADNPTWRAHCTADVVNAPMQALERNRVIVRRSELMIATPLEPEEMRYGGTWATVREAHRQAKPIYIILPNGRVVPPVLS